MLYTFLILFHFIFLSMYNVVCKKCCICIQHLRTSLIVKSVVYSFRIFIYSAFLISTVYKVLYIMNFGLVIHAPIKEVVLKQQEVLVLEV